MRFLPKGGVWKNTEDEILKASVMKYGLNQWSRISSLLTRKSAKQCKSRWYEWLDPSIKKTEWTKEEEEKLLHLAKIMPTQWRTIAPIIGRTASQCLDHYEKLISMHEAETEGDGLDPKRLRPGEIDPAPETKPARPDPVDMDEDELEMLQEARARLANTKGKKAKRKARERMLKEARRLASIQKRNELSAAGIKIKRRSSRNDTSVDYNAEIPFRIRQPIGFYDTFEEDKFAMQNKEILDFRRLTTAKFEGDPEKEEAVQRRKDLRRQKLYKEACLPDAIKEINKMNDPKAFKSRRADLVLPKPQVSSEDLENIAKLFPDEGLTPKQIGPSSLLVSQQTPVTPLAARTPLARDFRQKDIQDNIALLRGSNPLLGGESVKLNDPNFARKPIQLENAPKNSVVTPNVLVSAALQKSGLTPSITPGMTPSNTPYTPLTPSRAGENFAHSTFLTPLTPGRTPIRDSLNLNTPSAPQYLSSSLRDGVTSANFDLLPDSKGTKRERQRKRKRLQKSFRGLPKAKFRGSLKIVLPEIKQDTFEEVAIEQDMEDIAERKENEIKRKTEEESKLQSTVAKKGLAIPSLLNKKVKFVGDFEKNQANYGDFTKEEIEEADKMIEKEYYSIIRSDISKPKPVFTKEEETLMPEVLRLLAEEQEKLPNPAAKEFEEFSERDLMLIHSDLLFIPESSTYGFLSYQKFDPKINALRQEFELVKNRTEKIQRANERAKEKSALLFGGFQLRAQKAQKKISDMDREIQEKKREFVTFERIYRRENFAIPMRHEKLKKEVHEAMNLEKQLQKRYEKLFAKYRKLVSTGENGSN